MKLSIFPFSIYKVEGHSMEPSLKEGDRIIALKWCYLFSSPKKRDIIIFKNPKETNKIYIKRIAKIVNNNIYVEGDNKSDTKKLSTITRRDILAKVLSSY